MWHHNIQNKGERKVQVAIYVSSDLDSEFLKSSSNGPEFVFIKLKLQKGRYITVGNVYRSPKSTRTDDLQLCSEIEHLTAEAKKDVIILKDFNFPEIDWDLHHHGVYGSTSCCKSRILSDFDKIWHVDAVRTC